MYLVQAYQKSKPFFYACVCFMLGQAFFTFKGVETLPFFNFGMYSEPTKAQTKGYWIMCGKDTLNPCFSHLSASFLNQNIAHAFELKHNGIHHFYVNPWKNNTQPPFVDKQQHDFEQWLKRYTNEVSGINCTKLKIIEQ